MRGIRARLDAFVASEEAIARTASLARSKGCRILLVGGAIRDLALGRPVADLDFILEGSSGPFLRALSKALGRRVVTFRKRGIVDHRLRVGGREWDFVERGRRSLRREILRRDFGLNAVAYDPVEGRLHDPAGGLRDLSRRRIRAVSSRAFRDDPLRMLRAVRLRAEIPSLSIERRTGALIRRDARLLRRASRERIKSELDRILQSDGPSAAVRHLERLDLLREVLPELEPLRGLAQNRYHHLDAFAHTLAALEAADEPRALARSLPAWALSPDPASAPPRGGAGLGPERARILRWALLLHDTGKAETRTLGDDGDYHFYMHERASAAIARRTLRRLRASRAEIAAVERIVALHLRISLPSEGGFSPRAQRRIVKEAGDLTPLLVLHSLADKIASRGPRHPATLASLRRAGRELLETWKREVERSRREPRFVDGRDVMRIVGLPPGPAVGAVLGEAEERQACGELRSREEALRWLEGLRRERPAD